MIDPPAESRSGSPAKNPRRVAAGRHNRLKRRPITEGGRERLRATIRRNRPWESSPRCRIRTPAGQARAELRALGAAGDLFSILRVRLDD